MRCLNRNKTAFYYATYESRTPIVKTDEYGNEFDTGEYELEYSDPVLCKANISPVTGFTGTEIFGVSDGYDRVIVIDNPEIPIDEYTVLWIGADPDTAPYNFVVKKVARSLNSVAIAVSKVDVSE